MSRVSGSAPRIRIPEVAAVLLVHVAALLLIVVERSTSRERPEQELQYVSLWPQARVDPEKAEQLPRADGSTRIAALAVRAPLEQPVLPVKEPIQSSASAGAGVTSLNPTVDWRAAAKGAAARIVQAGSGQQGFSAAPQVQRKPCKPRVFDENTKQLMEERLPTPTDPDLVAENPTANCIIVGGYPKCVQKLTVKPRHREAVGDLVRERRAGRKSAESVPSLETCE